MSSITYLGHACILLDFENTKILVDPYISPNPKAKHINILDIECDYICITHAHQDHIHDVEKIVENTSATIIANFEIANYYSNK